MTWLNEHTKSEVFAAQAEAQCRVKNYESSLDSYLAAAQCEARAFSQVDPRKPRTLGILAVSATALFLKAKQSAEAERFAIAALSNPLLATNFRQQLKQLLQDAWFEQEKDESNVKFLPGQVQVSVRGQQIMHGAAPLDLVVEKVKSIQSIFYRAIENLNGDPLRVSGSPRQEIINACQPWLVQLPAGSYQFGVALQKPEQSDLFRDGIDPQAVVKHFLDIVRAGVAEDAGELEAVVPRKEYRGAFLKLTRALMPPGKDPTFDAIEIRAMGEAESVILSAATRHQVTKRLRIDLAKPNEPQQVREVIHGVLRGLHLDKDWIEIVDEAKSVRITGLGGTLEDVIGPMTNRRVTATVVRKSSKKLSLVDIELE